MEFNSGFKGLKDTLYIVITTC